MSEVSPAVHLNSRSGLAALVTDACLRKEGQLLAAAFSPLLPETCPWSKLADVPPEQVKNLQPKLSHVARALAEYRDSLTSSAGRLTAWLEASDEEVREVAIRYAKFRLPARQKLPWAERLLGSAIPGHTVETKWARINDARFWRRAIRVRLLREREHFYLRLNLIGRARESYVSDQQLQTRTRQLKQQRQWMEDTVLVPRFIECGEQAEGPLTLAQVAASPKTRFAKLYSFTKAMDEIATAEGLAAAMLTLTLEPEWHPNPSHGACNWNGATPREGHQVIAKRWQSILRDLHRTKVGLSGLRVVEPHKDGCPHWHLWLLYRPEVETHVLAIVMKYFPGKLKIRAPSRKGERLYRDDRICDTRADLLSGHGRAPRNANEGAQVEMSRIDRSISSGASYAMKYLLKTVDAGDQLNQDADLFGAMPAAEQDEQRAQHQATAQRVDAYRSLWGINAAQLFGVAKCLSAWDELRRLTQPPAHNKLRELWSLARGSDKPGQIPKCAGQRGNPRAFLEALGGLAACRRDEPHTILSIERLTVAGINGYGECIRRNKGVCLVQRGREHVCRGQINHETGEIYQCSGTRSVKTVLTSVVTRLTEWVLSSKQMYATAVVAAQERAHRRAAAQTPAGLGKQARQHFWSTLWQAWETLCPEERYPIAA